MFGAVTEILDRASRLNEKDAFIFAINNDIKEKIISLNTRFQLNQLGEDALGDSLGDYSHFTVEKKKLGGKRFDHITLEDTGAFYDSFKVDLVGDSLVISADDVAFYDEPLTDVFGDEIIGLNDVSLGIIIDLIQPRLIKYVERKLRI